VLKLKTSAFSLFLQLEIIVVVGAERDNWHNLTLLKIGLLKKKAFVGERLL